MNLQERLSREIKAAMLARDADRLSTLRLLKSALGYLEIERKTGQLSDADFIAVVQKEVKRRREAAEQFEKAGRVELAAKETGEARVLEEFLPQPLSPEELEALVQETIQEVGASTKTDMGAVIRCVRAKAAGRADGRSVSAMVGRILP